MRCLYLQENLIKRMENLAALTNLVNLNLSDNCIQKIENLASLTSLTTLLLKRNQLGRGGLSDLLGLLECPSLSCLDVQQNHIEEDTFPQEVVAGMAAMAVIYMQNNPFTKKISHYRKTIINLIPELKYLDDKPVFEDEKRFAFAWKRGGLDEERLERHRYKEEKEQQHMRNHLAFREMMDRAKAEREARERRESASQTSSDPNPSSIETYNSPDGSVMVSKSSQQNSEQLPSCSEPSEASIPEREGSVHSVRSEKSKVSERSIEIFQMPTQPPQPLDDSVPDLQTVEPNKIDKNDIDFEELD